jgi:hypothetical protein
MIACSISGAGTRETVGFCTEEQCEEFFQARTALALGYASRKAFVKLTCLIEDVRLGVSKLSCGAFEPDFAEIGYNLVRTMLE